MGFDEEMDEAQWDADDREVEFDAMKDIAELFDEAE